MLPYLKIFSIQIPMYGLCILTGLAAASFTSFFLSKKKKLNFYDFIIISTCTISSAMIFAKLLYIFIEFPLAKFFEIILSILLGKDKANTLAGFVFYGGLIGSLSGYYIGCKLSKCRLSDFLNIFAVITPLAHSFGRLGCFCAGCCYGKETSSAIHVKFSSPLSSVATQTPVIPIQLYEASALLIIFAFNLYLFHKKEKLCTSFYLISYSVTRFFIEFYRGDFQRGFLGFFSTSQIISIVIFFIGISILLFPKIKSSGSLKNY